MQELFAFNQYFFDIAIIAGLCILALVAIAIFSLKRLSNVSPDSELWTEHLLHNALDCALFSITTEGVIKSWNTASWRQTGYRAKDVMGKPLEHFYVPRSSDSELFRSPLSPSHRKEAFGFVKRKDGSMFWAQIVVASMPHSKTHFSVVIKDLSEQEKLEDKVKLLQSQLQILAVRQEKIREEERRRIARDLHDELGQVLTLFKIKLSKFAETVSEPESKKRDEAIQKQLDWILGGLDTAVQNVRKIATNLRPPILDKLGLIPALAWYIEELAQSTGLACCFLNNVTTYRGTPDQTTMLFRTTQELLTNIVKHARAHDVIVSLSQDSDKIKLEVQDNGIGIIESDLQKKDSSGILGLQKRLASMDGTLKFEGRLPKGTRAVVTMPLYEKYTECLEREHIIG